MAKKTKAGKASKGGSDRSFIVASKAKEYLKGLGRNTAGDALDGLNAVCEWYLQQAAKRADANGGRKTVRKHDFMA
jgi:hypothetical protein